jgi:primosomal protein N' (replication factor Y)
VARVVDVFFKLPLWQPFSYRLPAELETSIGPGDLVRVPWQKLEKVGMVVRNRQLLEHESSTSLKEVLGKSSPVYRLSSGLLELCEFVAEYYCTPLGEVLAAASMVGFSDVQRQAVDLFEISPALAPSSLMAFTAKQRSAALQVEKLDEVERLPATVSEWSRRVNCSTSIVQQLIKKNFLSLQLHNEATLASPPRIADHQFLALNAEQQIVYDALKPLVVEGRYETILLQGVTGSGKTEVYLHLLRDALLLGGSALCLVPEISLTPQTLARFQERFGDCVGMFHSQLTRLQKLDLFHDLQSGKVRIVLGARSAVFCDLPNCKLILVDEEHDPSYKQNESPRYHARDIAIYRGRKLGVPVVLGTATPSMESWWNAQQGKYKYFTLHQRATNQELPKVEIIELGKELKQAGKPTVLTRRLVEEIQERVARGEQSLLFLNRRGWTNFLFCPVCNWVAKCSEDDVALTVHRVKSSYRLLNKSPQQSSEESLFFGEEASFEEETELPGVEPPEFLKCHFCGKREDLPHCCPECGNEKLARVGLGTQRLEESVEECFPGVPLVRLDQDTIGSRQAYAEAWARMTQEKVPLILGTQMIAKGIHLADVTLVGIVLADTGLHLPDFRVNERVFQTLTQVAGRAGRESPGLVLVQTYQPGHPAIRFACQQDSSGFLAWELKNRELLRFPPFTSLAILTCSDPDRERARSAASTLGFHLRKLAPFEASKKGGDQIQIFGPTVPPMQRTEGRYRFRLLIRSPRNVLLGRLMRKALDRVSGELSSSTRCIVDIDPQDFS